MILYIIFKISKFNLNILIRTIPPFNLRKCPSSVTTIHRASQNNRIHCNFLNFNLSEHDKKLTNYNKTKIKLIRTHQLLLTTIQINNYFIIYTSLQFHDIFTASAPHANQPLLVRIPIQFYNNKPNQK